MKEPYRFNHCRQTLFNITQINTQSRVHPAFYPGSKLPHDSIEQNRYRELDGGVGVQSPHYNICICEGGRSRVSWPDCSLCCLKCKKRFLMRFRGVMTKWHGVADRKLIWLALSHLEGGHKPLFYENTPYTICMQKHRTEIDPLVSMGLT